MQPAKIQEKDGLRGLVPSRTKGSLDRVYAAYLNELNPRYNLDVQAALSTTEDPRFKEFLERISDYKYRNVSLQAIAKGCLIDLSDFSKWWRKSCSQRAVAIATEKSVKITSDMAQDAMSVSVACAKCDGLGWVSAPPGLTEDNQPEGYRSMQSGKEEIWIRDCPNGCTAGKVRKPGDYHARDKILEMSGLIQKGKGIQINQNFGMATHASAVANLKDIMTLDIEPEDGN